MRSKLRYLVPIAALFSTALFSTALRADELSGPALLKALHEGGNTLVMRHANAPQQPPDDATADKDNPKHERQLDDAGKNDARAIGAAIKKQHISISPILSSPTFRARQTVHYASLGDPTIVQELDENPQGMTAGDAPGSAWLKKKAAMPVKAKSNVLLVTHFPNIRGAFGDNAAKVDAGEILVVHADKQGGATIIGRIKPQDWAKVGSKP